MGRRARYTQREAVQAALAGEFDDHLGKGRDNTTRMALRKDVQAVMALIEDIDPLLEEMFAVVKRRQWRDWSTATQVEAWAVTSVAAALSSRIARLTSVASYLADNASRVGRIRAQQSNSMRRQGEPVNPRLDALDLEALGQETLW